MPPPAPQPRAFNFTDVAPELTASIETLAQEWLSPLLSDGRRYPDRNKQFNDPIWGTITLYPWEVALLDTPLIQRLRGVKQLGMAHLVFTGATHDRFAHVCGTVEAAERMTVSLLRNAATRREFGDAGGVEDVSARDQYTLRLAALLHDIGHGPFSHAIEPVVTRTYAGELSGVESRLREHYKHVKDISTSEIIAVLLISSQAFHDVLKRPFLSKLVSGREITKVVKRIIACVIGYSDGTAAGSLCAIISGQLDADKLDYMARDAYHAGLPVDFDTDRLTAKLEFVMVETGLLLPNLQSLRSRLIDHKNGRYQDVGIAYGATGAFEQMLIGRIFLYDRLYHHHKVRAADAMAQRLVHYASPDASNLNIRLLYAPVPDDSIVRAFGGQLKILSGGKELTFPVTPESRHIADAILSRKLYKRAFAFAGRFIGGLELQADSADVGRISEAEDDLNAERSRVMEHINRELSDFPARLEAEREIAELGRELGEAFPDDHILKQEAIGLGQHHLALDLRSSPYPARVTMIARMDDGMLDVPDLFYNPARWAEVYNIQRRTGYLFADPDYRAIACLAARVWFLRKFRCVLGVASDRHAKTNGIFDRGWLSVIQKAGLITTREEEYLSEPRLVYVPLSPIRIGTPKVWRETRPNLVQEFAKAFNEILEDGISAVAESALRATLSGVFGYLQSRMEDARFVTSNLENEKALQLDLARSLRDQSLDVIEGSKRAGGETDLIVEKRVLIENKLLSEPTDDPFMAVPRSGVQGRRYVLPTGQSFVVTVVGYSSRTENGKLHPADCFRVRQLQGIDAPFVEIRAVIRYGDTVPSNAGRGLTGSRKKRRRPDVENG